MSIEIKYSERVTVKKLLFIVVSFFLVTACGRSGESHPAHPLTQSEKVSSLSAKYEVYRTQSIASRAEGKFETDCDWLLFAGLNASVSGYVDFPRIMDARSADGEWQRNPVKPCYPEMSRSTSSKDMIVGLIWWAWRTNNLQVLVDFWDYAASRNGVFGRPYPEEAGRVLLTGNLLATLHETIYVLSNGSKNNPLRFLPDFDGGGQTGFEAHLSILVALLWGEVTEEGERRGLSPARSLTADKGVHLLSVKESAFGRIEEQYTRSPRNILFAAAHAVYTGDYDSVFDLYLDERHWPNDRLPSKAEHCEFWLPQRDEGADWEPCGSSEEIHSGGDWLFAVDLLLRRLAQ